MSYDLIPSRLTAIRELRCMTKSEVAEQVGLSVARIVQLEQQGEVRSIPELTLHRLSATLRVPISYFGKEPIERPSEDVLFFRARSRIPAGGRRRAEWLGVHFRELMAFIQDLGIITLPESRVPNLMSHAPEEAARRVRDAVGFGHGPIRSMVRLLEQLGVWVHRLPPGETDKVDAFSYWHEGQPNVVLNKSEDDDPYRDRFDCGHELGHLVMDRSAETQDHSTKEQEARANRFAAELLVPAEVWADEAPRTTDPWAYMDGKARWGASVACLIRRSRDAGVLDDRHYQYAQVRLSRLKWRKVEPRPFGPRRVPELPELLRECLGELRPHGWTLERLADQLGWGGDLMREVVGNHLKTERATLQESPRTPDIHELAVPASSARPVTATSRGELIDATHRFGAGKGWPR